MFEAALSRHVPWVKGSIGAAMATVISKNWSHGGRITCAGCGSQLQEANGSKIHLPSGDFVHSWDVFRTGEEILANFDQLPAARAASSWRLEMMFLRRSITRNDARRQNARGRVLDVFIPGFDDVDQPARLTAHTGCCSSYRWRSASLRSQGFPQMNPRLYDRMQRSFSGLESIRFVAATIKRLAGAHSCFLTCSIFKTSNPLRSRNLLQRSHKPP